MTEQLRIEQALKQSQAQIAAIMAASRSGILFMNKEYRVTFYNPAAEAMLGFRPDEAEGMNGAENVWRLYDPDTWVRIPREMRPSWRALHTGESVQNVEVGVEHPDGTRYTLLNNAEPLRDDHGTVTGVVLALTDITSQKEAARALAAAKAEAERASMAKSQFLSQMSHELRTPMNAILGFAQLMRLDPTEPLTRSQAENLEQIEKAGHHLLALINEVLDLSRIEAGRVAMSLEPVAIPPLIDEVLALMSPVAAQRQIELTCAPKPFAVWADRSLLHQVLVNLVANAVKYNWEGGRVSVACARRDDLIDIVVEDTGYGIAPEEHRQVFEPFYRSPAFSQQVEGSGIGLPLAKGFTELMGGTIGMDSVPGVGSRFTVSLLSAPDRAPLPGAEPSRPATPAPASSRGRTILYIEDNPSNVLLVQRILTARPAVRLLIAPIAAIGLNMALAHHPDLILCDIYLPDMDGFAVLERLQSREATRSIPVIAVSASAMPTEIDRGLKAGFETYLTKPVDVTLLLQTIDRYLKS